MSHRRYSFFGFSRNAKRNCAMFLIALWAMFSVSEVLASCCDPHGGRFQRSTESFAYLHATAAAEHADHDQADGTQHGDSHVPACPAAVDKPAPPAGSQTALSNDDASRELLASPVRSAWPETAARPWVERDGIWLSLAPPDRVYLRLQRLLI